MGVAVARLPCHAGCVHTFTVWAPFADTVDLVVDGHHIPMTPAGDRPGWWQATAENAGPGTDYAFSVDGGPPRPDPRTEWQPHGVDGPSRVFDPADAAIERLDHLRELGVDIVSLMPVAAFPGEHGWGYDGVDLFAVHGRYGGPAALQRFVDACHQRGLGVCLDVVYNHLGPQGNYLETFGPYFTDKHHTPWGKAVNLDDEHNDQVRRYICDNALRWFRDFRIDALRLDAVHELADDSHQHLLAQLSTETAALSEQVGRPLGLVAESDLNDPTMVIPVEQGGLGMTAQWSDDFHHALHALLADETHGYYVDFGDLRVLAKTLTEVFRHDGGFSTFRNRDWGAPVDRARIGGHRFLAYAANHDQVGNRAVGDRPAASLTAGRVAIGAAITLTSPFTPMLFMGEEWGCTTPFMFFSDHQDPDLAQAIRDGRRAEFADFGWAADQIPDPQDHATRHGSVLDWSDLDEEPHRRMLDWYRDLIALRRSESDLTDDRLDRLEVDIDEQAQTLVMTRGAFRVVVNLGPQQHRFELAVQRVALAFGEVEHDADAGLTVGPDSVAIARVG